MVKVEVNKISSYMYILITIICYKHDSRRHNTEQSKNWYEHFQKFIKNHKHSQKSLALMKMFKVIISTFKLNTHT